MTGEAHGPDVDAHAAFIADLGRKLPVRDGLGQILGEPGVSDSGSRMIELLTAAAHAMEDGRDPFLEGFLAEHDVTLTECTAMSMLLGAGALIVAKALATPGTVLSRWVELKTAENPPAAGVSPGSPGSV